MSQVFFWRIHMKPQIWVALFVAILFSASAPAEEGRHTLGLEAGHVALGGDVGSMYGNAVGGGIFFRYAASDFLEFEINLMGSRHSQNSLSLKQNSLGLAVLYNIDQFDIFVPYVKGGAEFVGHTQDLPSPVNPASYESNGFGLIIGAGAQVLLGANFMTGLDLTYHSIFDTTVTPTGGTATKAIQPYTTVMLQVGFRFGSK